MAPILALAFALGSGQRASACCWCGFGGYGGYGGCYGGGDGYGSGYGGYYGGGYGYGLGYGGYAWGSQSYGSNVAYGGYPGYGYVSEYPYTGYGYSSPYAYSGYSYPYNGYGYGYTYPGYVASYPTSNGTFSYTAGYAAPAVETSVAAGTPSMNPEPSLGVDTKEVVEPNGHRAMQVSKVYANTAAEQAGLQTGDVIRSANGYMTQVPGNLAWIIDNAAPDKVLKMTVLAAKDGREHMVTATVRK
jgi:hypothetical protein